MRISILIAAIALLVPVLAQAAPYGMAGCGLGSLAFGDDPGMVQVLAATTNGTFNSQTFGITTGTSNCVDNAPSASIDQKAFIHVNYASLQREAAVGRGEYLAAFATILGCPAEVQHDFFTLAQRKQGEWFVPGVASDLLLANILTALHNDPRLAASCTRV